MIFRTIPEERPAWARIYAACSSGFIALFSNRRWIIIKSLRIFLCREWSMAFAVDATHRVYAPEQQENGMPVA